MDHIFRLNLSDISQSKCEKDSLYLEATDVATCLISGKSEEYECKNHIRVIESIGEDLLYVCGTNANNPRDLIIYKSLKHLPRHVHYGHVGSGAGRCPGDPSHRSASLWVGEPTSALFAGTHSDSSLADRLLIRWDLRPGTSGYKRTARYNTKWLDGPEFVLMYATGQHVHALVRERSTACGTRNEARIVRVCLDDRGSKRHPRDWTTFSKASLSCNTQHFQHLEGAYEVGGRVFGVFTSGVDGAFAGSAICSFASESIDEVFAGKFAEYTGSGGKGEQPVPEESEPRPRPGSCGHDTTQLPDSTVNFIRLHPLMYETVFAEFGGPIFVQRDAIFTALVVDKLNYTQEGRCYFVYYCATGEGLVYKVVQSVGTTAATAFLVDVWKIFPLGTAIEAMTLSEGFKSVYFASDYGVKQIKLDGVCSRHYDSCVRCSRDPYCGWDAQRDACKPYQKGLFQDVENMSTRGCDDFIHPKEVSATYGQSVFLSSYFDLPEVVESSKFTWSKRNKDTGKIQLILRSDRFLFTASHGLVILGLGLRDAGLFECRQGNRIVALYNLTIDYDRCSQPLQNGSYHRIYLDWCRQFLKHKVAMKLWQSKRKEQCKATEQNWNDRSSNEVLPLY
ncbi:semaphorin-2A-like [Arctopsyche grandis]|uniref:semaphorin-2A-like n=1 Tax=Arctopsyche grandis TaxID=121162 RepID=UPI00406D9805